MRFLVTAVAAVASSLFLVGAGAYPNYTEEGAVGRGEGIGLLETAMPPSAYPFASADEEMEAYRNWNVMLPTYTISGDSRIPTEWNWNDMPVIFGRASFVGPSSKQWPASGCWLFSDVHVLQVLSAWRALQLGPPYTMEFEHGFADAGIHLRPWVWWDCADTGGSPEVLCDIFEYGNCTRWRSGWGEYFGYVENCIDPVEMHAPDGWADKRTCGICDRYRVVEPQDRPDWENCSWVQREHPDAAILYRHGAAASVDMSPFHPPGWPNTADIDFAAVMDAFAEVLYYHGPQVVGIAPVYSASDTPGVYTCNNTGQVPDIHLVAMVAYNKSDPDYHNKRTVIIQESDALGTKSLKKLDFDAFVIPWQVDGCAMGWVNHHFPDGALDPYELTRYAPPVVDPPLRCDVDGDGVDGFGLGLQVDNCPEVYNTDDSDCELCEPGATPADDFDPVDGVGDVCMFENLGSCECYQATSQLQSYHWAHLLGLLGLAAFVICRRRS